jgi:hypothetical protein
MLTELQQSIQAKYPQITFDHDKLLAFVEEDKFTDRLQEEIFSYGYIPTLDKKESHFVYRWLSKNVSNKEYPLLQRFEGFRKDRRENLLKVLAFVFFFSCQCEKHKDMIWISQAYVAEKTGLNRHTVGQGLKTLGELGILDRINTGNHYEGQASVYMVSAEVFCVAVKSVVLCNEDLRGAARAAFFGGLRFVPIFDNNEKLLKTSIRFYGDSQTDRMLDLLPNTEDLGCRVEWHTPCYSGTFQETACRGVEIEPVKNTSETCETQIPATRILLPSTLPLRNMVAGFEKPQKPTVLPTENGVSSTTGVNAKMGLKDAFFCVSVYEHSLDFSNLVIGPKTRFPEVPFESSA